VHDRYQDFFASFEKEGESQIRIRLATGELGVTGDLFGAALEWLRLKEEERNEARYSSTSRRARRAEITAIIAAIIAAASIIKDIIIFMSK
jgi:hypothetical protein